MGMGTERRDHPAVLDGPRQCLGLYRGSTMLSTSVTLAQYFRRHSDIQSRECGSVLLAVAPVYGSHS